MGVDVGAISACNPQSAYIVEKSRYTPSDDLESFAATHSRLILDGDTPAKRLGISEEEYNSTETPAEAIGISKEDYFAFFSFDRDKGKRVFFPPADTPVDVQRAWYDMVSSLDPMSRGQLSADIDVALRYGDYYTNTMHNLPESHADMMDRIKNLGGVGCLQLISNTMSHQLSDMAYNGLTEERYRLLVQSRADAIDRVLDKAKEHLDGTRRRQIALANEDFLLHKADAIGRVLDRAKKNWDETRCRQIELENEDFLLHEIDRVGGR